MLDLDHFTPASWPLTLCILLSLCFPSTAARFYADDPVLREPDPMDVSGLKPRKVNDWYDYYRNTFQHPGESNTGPAGVVRAQNTNTLGEVPDGAWYTNRTLTPAEVGLGPSPGGNAPDMGSPWEIVSAKTEGVTPGFVVRDGQRRRYILKFDPLDNREMATGADAVVARLLYALGYHVPENYVVVFTREQLRIAANTKFVDPFGRHREMRDRDVTEILLRVPRIPSGPDKDKIRAVASLYLTGTPLGPFKYYGRRESDLNDYIRHEHRRELRGLHVFSAWLNHHDARAINTLDMLVEEKGVHYVRHYLIDFGSTLGSAATKSKSAREGNAPLYDMSLAARSLFTFGALPERWERAHYPYYEGIGRLQWDAFDAEAWVPNYPNRAFLNRLPDDTFWAARKLMQLSDDAIRAAVATGQYSDPEAAAWLTECLTRRRDIAARTYFAKVLPLMNFSVQEGKLVFDDLAVKHKFTETRQYTIRWSRLDSNSGATSPLQDATDSTLPQQVREAASGTYWQARIDAGEAGKQVHVTVRCRRPGIEVVGVEYTW